MVRDLCASGFAVEKRAPGVCERLRPATDPGGEGILPSHAPTGAQKGYGACRAAAASRAVGSSKMTSGTKRHRLRPSGLEPRACIVSGKLDQITHGSRRFKLEVGHGQAIHGRLIGDATDLELVRSLWRRPATVQGIVHFRADGQPRLIEADRIASSSDGHEVFRVLPQAADVSELPASPSKASVHPVAKTSDLIGAWPGQEPVEQLLSVLRETRAIP